MLSKLHLATKRLTFASALALSYNASASGSVGTAGGGAIAADKACGSNWKGDDVDRLRGAAFGKAVIVWFRRRGWSLGLAPISASVFLLPWG